MTSPPDGGAVGTSPITVRGTVSDESALVQVENSFGRVRAFGFSAPGVTLQEGLNTLVARAANRQGKVVQVSHRIVLDSTPPVIEVLAPSDRTFARSDSTQLLATVRDLTTVQCDIDSRSVSVTGEAPDFRLTSNETLVEGENVLVITCVDAVGHTSSQSVTVYFDPSLLRVTGVSPNAGSAGVAREARVTVSFSEPVADGTIRPETFFLTASGVVLPGTTTLTDERSATFAPAFFLPPGQEIRVNVTRGVTDRTGNPLSVAFASAFFTRGSATEPGAVLGEVFDDTRSLPIGGAEIAVIDAATDALIGTLVSSERGQFLLPPNVEHLLVRITKDGFTTVDREIVTTGAVFTELLDARITPLAAPLVVEGRLGETITTPLGDAVSITPGGFPGSAEVRFTSISEQGPQAPFPPGWAPLGIVEIGSSVGFSRLPTIQIVDRSQSAVGRQGVAVRYDPAQRLWLAIEVVPVAADGAIVTVVDRPAQYAVLVADDDPDGPGPPIIGEPLPGAVAEGFPTDAEATGSVEPSQGRVDDPSAVRATVVVTATEPIRSGTPLRGDFMERFILAAGGNYAPPGNSQDLVTYRSLTDPGGTTASAEFAIAPSRTFALTDATSGLITVDLAEGQPMDRTLVANGGGIIVDDGSRLGVPAGAFTTAVPVSLRRVPSDAFPTSIPTGFTFVGAFDIDLAGQIASQPLSLVLESPEVDVRTGEQVVLAQILTVLGRERFVPVALGRQLGSGIATETEVEGVQFPGIVEGGRYVFLSIPEKLVPIAGTVRHADGTLAGHVLEVFDLPFAAISDAAGRFAVLARPGVFTLTATGGHIHDQVTVTADTATPLGEIVIVASGPRVVRLEVRPPPIQGGVAGPVVLLGKPAPVVDDDSDGESRGNGDGVIAAGERIEFSLTVMNQGNRTAPAGFFVLQVLTPQGSIQVAPASIDVDPLPPDVPLTVGPFVFEVPAGSDPVAFTYDLIYEIDGSQVGQGSLRGNEVPFPLPLGVEHHQVSLGSEITVTFSEAIAIEAVRAGAQLVRDDTGASIDFTVVATEDATTFKLRPTRFLQDATVYRVTFSASVVDSDGRSLMGAPYTERLRTVDRTPPAQIAPGKIEANAPDTRGIVVITGGPGSVNPTDVVIVINETTGLTVLAVVALDGSFRGEIRAAPTDQLALIVRDLNDNQTRIPIDTLVRRDPTSGEVVGALIGAKGGAFEGDDIELIVPPGAVSAPTDFSLERDDTPFELPADVAQDQSLVAAFEGQFQAVNRFNLNAAIRLLRNPVRVALPAPPGTSEGDLFVLARLVDVQIGGLSADLDRVTGVKAVDDPRRTAKRLEIIESATAKNVAGLLRVSTDSPPFPGILESGNYILFRVKQKLAFLTGSVVHGAPGVSVRGAVVRSGPEAISTALFVFRVQKDGRFVIPDGAIDAASDASALATRMTVRDPVRDRTITRKVSATTVTARPPSTSIYAIEPFTLPDTLPSAFVDILGDLEPPRVSMTITGAGLRRGLADIGQQLDVVVSVKDDDAAVELILSLDQGQGAESVPIDAAGHFSFTPLTDALLTFRAEATDSNGNHSEVERHIRTRPEGQSLTSIPGVPPVVLLSPPGDVVTAPSNTGARGARAASAPERKVDDVSFDAPLSLRLSEPLDPATINDTNVTLIDPDGAEVGGIVSLADGNSRMVISPDHRLRLGACYTVQFSPGVRDLNGDLYSDGNLAVNIPAPVQVATVPLQNARDIAPVDSNQVVSVKFPDTAEVGDNGAIFLVRIREDGKLLREPVVETSSPTRGQPLTVATNGERIFVGNRFLGPIASMRAVLNPFGFLLPGLPGPADAAQGFGSGLLQCAQNPLLCFGVQLVWESFPLPPSNVEVFAISDESDVRIKAEDVEELNRVKSILNFTKNDAGELVPVFLPDDVFALNMPGVWGPNTWPLKATLTNDTLRIANSHMNVEFFPSSSDSPLRQTNLVERVMGVGQRLGRCQGNPTTEGRVCTISWLDRVDAGARDCGAGTCVPTFEFRDVAFFDDFVASTEEGLIRLVDTDVTTLGERVGMFGRDRTEQTILLEGAETATLASAKKFAWRGASGETEAVDLLFVEQEALGLEIYNVTDGEMSERITPVPLPVQGNMSVDECRGLLYLRGTDQLHIIDFNDLTNIVELNAPGTGRVPFAIENNQGWNLARMSSRDHTLFVPGRAGFEIVSTRRCGHVSRACEDQAPALDGRTFNDGCAVKAPALSRQVPVRAACLGLGAYPDEAESWPADGPNPIVGVSVFIPDSELPDVMVPVAGGTVQWSVQGPGGSVSEIESPLVDGFAFVDLRTSRRAGDVYRVTAKVRSLVINDEEIETNLVKATAPITIVPGEPNQWEFEPRNLQFPPDQQTDFKVTATLRDRLGNLVADGTPSMWLVEGDSRITLVSSDSETTGGQSTANFVAGELCGHNGEIRIGLSTGGRTEYVGANVEPLVVTVAIEKSVLDVQIGETALVEATITSRSGPQVPDGTPVRWFTSNGFIHGDAVVRSGRASAVLSSAGGRLGKAAISAVVANFADFTSVDFVSSAPTRLRLADPFLVSDAPHDGLLTAERGDGTMLSVPFHVSTRGLVDGSPHARVKFSVSGLFRQFDLQVDEFSNDTIYETVTGTPIQIEPDLIDRSSAAIGTASLRLSSDDVVRVPAGRPLARAENFIASVWINPSALTDSKIVERVDLFGFHLSDGHVRFDVPTNNGTASVSTTERLAAGIWYRLEGEFQGGRLSLRVESAGSPAQVVEASSDGLLIESDSDVVIGGAYSGGIDDVVITATEAGAGGLIAIDGLDSQGHLLLDASGHGEVTVRTTGQPGDRDGIDLASISVSASPTFTQSIDIAREEEALKSFRFIANTIYGAPKNATFWEALGPEMLAGMIGYGDARDIAFQLLIASGSCEEQDNVVLALATTGLLLDICQLAGVTVPVCTPINAVFAALKTLVKTTGKAFIHLALSLAKRVRTIFVLVVTKGLSGASDLLRQVKELADSVAPLSRAIDEGCQGAGCGLRPLEVINDVCGRAGGALCDRMHSVNGKLQGLDPKFADEFLGVLSTLPKATSHLVAARLAVVLDGMGFAALESVRRGRGIKTFCDDLAELMIRKDGTLTDLSLGKLTRLLNNRGAVASSVKAPAGTLFDVLASRYRGWGDKGVSADQIVGHLAEYVRTFGSSGADELARKMGGFRGVIGNSSVSDGIDGIIKKLANDDAGLVLEMVLHKDAKRAGRNGIPSGRMYYDTMGVDGFDLDNPRAWDDIKSTLGAFKNGLNPEKDSKLIKYVANRERVEAALRREGRLGREESLERATIIMSDSEFAKHATQLRTDKVYIKKICEGVQRFVVITPLGLGQNAKRSIESLDALCADAGYAR